MIQVEKEIKLYVSLEELIDDLSKDLFLKTPCQENRDFSIVFLPTYEAGGYLDMSHQEELTAMLDAMRNDPKSSKKSRSQSGKKSKGKGEKKERKKKSKKDKETDGKGEKKKKPKTTKKKTKKTTSSK